MENKKVYLAKVIYSLYMGIFMGFIITGGFLVIITNIDKYFFNSIIGIRGDWLYYTGTILLIPVFGAVYIYNKRITIDDNVLEIRENGLSFNVSKMDVSTIKSISLHKQKRGRRFKLGLKIADGNTAIMVSVRPFNKKTLSKLLKDLININPNIEVDDYFKNLLKSN